MKADRELQKYSLKGKENVFCGSAVIGVGNFVDAYQFATLEPLCFFHLKVSKTLKVCTAGLLSSSTAETSPSQPSSKRRKPRSVKNQNLQGINNVLAAFQNELYVSGIHVAFSTSKKSAHLIGFIKNTDVKGMIEGKDYPTIDIMFPLVSALVGRKAGFTQHAKLTGVHTAYSDIINTLHFNADESISARQYFQKVAARLLTFELKAVELFCSFENMILFTSKFHRLDHVATDSFRFRNHSALDASAFEHFNHTNKKLILMTSM